MEQAIIGDILGPEYIIKVYHPKLKVWGFLVIDNTRRGPGKGGIRMTATVNEEEVWRLARAMTLKNALANIPFGGAKAGIAFEPRPYPPRIKNEVIRWFADALKPLVPRLYIAGPDINTGQKEMALFARTIGTPRAATGKPRSLGGLPHELGSTGFGVAEAAQSALQWLGQKTKDATVAIAGFGNVGTFAARFLSNLGSRIVAVSDSQGAVYSRTGLDYKNLMRVKKEKGSVVHYPAAEIIAATEIFTLPVDVLIPAALPDVINEKNVETVRAKIIVQGANIPIREEFERRLDGKGIMVIPDIVANAGGVISSYAEYKGYGIEKMFALVRERITVNVQRLLQAVKKNRQYPRAVATALAYSAIKGTKTKPS